MPRPPTCGTCSRARRSSTPIPERYRPPGRSDCRPAPRLSGDARDRARRSGPSSTGSAASSRSTAAARSAACACIPRSSTSWSARSSSTDLRVYQAQVSAKYTGDANFEQPMHTDRNHSCLPPRMEPPWWHVESFLYLSDVDEGTAPTHLVRRGDAVGRSTNRIFMPDDDPELYAAERAAVGVPRFAARVPARRVPSRRRPDAPGRPPLPVERQLQGRGHRLDRLPHACSRTRRIRRGCSSSRRRRRASSSCSGSRRPVIRCGRRRSSTRRARSIRSSTSSLGGARFVDDRGGHGPEVAHDADPAERRAARSRSCRSATSGSPGGPTTGSGGGCCASPRRRSRARRAACCGSCRRSRSARRPNTCATELTVNVTCQSSTVDAKNPMTQAAPAADQEADDAERPRPDPVVLVEEAQLGVLGEVADLACGRPRCTCRRGSSRRGSTRSRAWASARRARCRRSGGGCGGARPTTAGPSARPSCRRTRARTARTRLSR